jgi:ribosomal protein S18 acetylase RimI-like enzyme
MMNPISLRRGEPKDLERLAEVMDNAFRGRPLSDFFASRELQWRGLVRDLFRAVICVSLDHYQVICAGDPAEGVAIWEAPMTPAVPGDAWTEAGLGSALEAIGEGAPERVAALFSHLGETQQRLRPPDSWYLVGIGVIPEAQGRGVGRAMLEWGVRRAEQTQSCVFLETNEARNVPFYEGVGCRVVEFEEFGTSRFPIWHMRRDASA